MPSSIALYFITSLLSFSVVNIGGICMIHTTAPFSSRFWMVSFMFLYICFALDPCLISFVPVWISTFIPSMFSTVCASDHSSASVVVIVAVLIISWSFSADFRSSRSLPEFESPMKVRLVFSGFLPFPLFLGFSPFT